MARYLVTRAKVRGRELSQRVRALRPEMRVVFLSGYTENGIVRHGRLDEGVQLIGKPFKRDQLARKVAEALGAPTVPAVEPGIVVALRPGREA